MAMNATVLAGHIGFLAEFDEAVLAGDSPASLLHQPKEDRCGQWNWVRWAQAHSGWNRCEQSAFEQ